MERSYSLKPAPRLAVIIAAVLGLLLSVTAVVAPKANAVTFTDPVKDGQSIRVLGTPTFTKGTSYYNQAPSYTGYNRSESPRTLEPVDGNLSQKDLRFSVYSPSGTAIFKNQTGWDRMQIWDAYGNRGTQHWTAYCIDPLGADPGQAGSYSVATDEVYTHGSYQVDTNDPRLRKYAATWGSVLSDVNYRSRLVDVAAGYGLPINSIGLDSNSSTKFDERFTMVTYAAQLAAWAILGQIDIQKTTWSGTWTFSYGNAEREAKARQIVLDLAQKMVDEALAAQDPWATSDPTLSLQVVNSTADSQTLVVDGDSKIREAVITYEAPAGVTVTLENGSALPSGTKVPFGTKIVVKVPAGTDPGSVKLHAKNQYTSKLAPGFVVKPGNGSSQWLIVMEPGPDVNKEVTVDWTISWEATPRSIATKATDAADNDQRIDLSKSENTIADGVHYAGLKPNAKYEMETKLQVAGSQPANLVPISTPDATVSKTSNSFVTKQTASGNGEGDWKVNIKVQTKDLATLPADARLTVQQYVWELDGSGRRVGDPIVHENGEGQTVETFNKPQANIGTVAKLDGDSRLEASREKDVPVAKDSVIVDEVKYTGLIPGVEYRVEGRLVSKPDARPVLGKDGREVTASTTFTPQNSDGSVELKFPAIDPKAAVPGASFVAFEKLYQKDVPEPVATHEDINDASQTVTVVRPEVRTDAKVTENGAADGKQVKFLKDDNGAKITDTVSFNSLFKYPSGENYTLNGKLMVREADGRATETQITATKKFNPSSVDGNVELEFNLSREQLEKLAGKTVVVYEQIMLNGVEVGKHEDINDAKQTVLVPKIATSARDGEAGAANDDKNIAVKNDSKVIDTVTYEGLIPNKQYTLKAQLMDKATNEPVGDAVTTSFTPGSSNGTKDVNIPFDASKTPGKTLVVFEELYVGDANGELVSEHKDINDQAQTVFVDKPTPSILIEKLTWDPQAGDKAKVADGKFELRKGDEVLKEFDLSVADNKFQFPANGFDPNATYTLIETQSPQGYSLLPAPVPFTLQWNDTSNKYEAQFQNLGDGALIDATEADDSGVILLAVTDVKTGELPKSGGNGLLPWIAAALGLIAAGIFTGRKARN